MELVAAQVPDELPGHETGEVTKLFTPLKKKMLGKQAGIREVQLLDSGLLLYEQVEEDNTKYEE